MSRLIDADALKEHIDKLPALPDGNFAGNHSALKALINMQPTIEPAPQWIPNTPENVPKDPFRKQIQLANGWIITGWFDGEKWFPVPEIGATLLFDFVLAWCELPSPYQPESEEEEKDSES